MPEPSGCSLTGVRRLRPTAGIIIRVLSLVAVGALVGVGLYKWGLNLLF